MKTDLVKGGNRFFDWTLDLVANGDVLKITELWLLCPPSQTSPLGNTARLNIEEPGTAFQLKIATVDSSVVESSRTMQAHIIGKVTNKETGDCDCYIWDAVQDGLCTPETMIYDVATVDHIKRDVNGNPLFAGKANIYNFHSWRDSIAPLGRLGLDALGIRL